MKCSNGGMTRSGMKGWVRFSLWVERWVSRGMTVLAILIFTLVGYSYYDMYRFTRAGIDGVEYRDFPELLQINPDTVAWISLDGTAVDHPVVQGKDNFEYLDRNFYGKDYAGGTIFLDEQCSRDFHDEYQLIHGHHMSGGAMFGDLRRYLEEEFFRENKSGQLLTPNGNYDLQVVGAGVFSAYDSSIYRVDGRMERPLKALPKCKRVRERKEEDKMKLLALSTCSGDMDDRRIVIFCVITKRSS